MAEILDLAEIENGKSLSHHSDAVSIVDETGECSSTAARRLESYFKLPEFPSEQIAVIYDNVNCQRKFSYEAVQKLYELVRNKITELEDSNATIIGPFIGVGCVQDIYYPSVLLGILHSGHGFFCLDRIRYNCEKITFAYSDQKTTLELLQISYFLVDHVWISENLEEMKKVLDVEILWTELIKPTTLTIKEPSDFGEQHVPEDIKLTLIRMVALPEPTSFKRARTDYLNLQMDEGSKSDWAYAIRTSGTSGNRKIVLVPHECITPNLDSLQEYLNVRPSSVIFGCASPTFDPSVIDLFLTLNESAVILYVSEDIKLNPAKLTQDLIINKVTILQMTPSMFYRFNKAEKLNLCSSGHIEAILLGGEMFPKTRNELESLMCFRDADVYNIYGTTELSCWATICRLNDRYYYTGVPVGKVLGETKVIISHNADADAMIDRDDHSCGDIWIGSESRVTTVIAERTGEIIPPNVIIENGQKIKYRNTGDVGYSVRRGDQDSEEEEEFIYITGRNDRLVKRNGKFIDLEHMKEQLLASNKFTFVFLFEHLSKIYLVYQTLSDNRMYPDADRKKYYNTRCVEDTIKETFTNGKGVDALNVPDHFIHLGAYIPVTTNLKLDEESLKRALVYWRASTWKPRDRTICKLNLDIHTITSLIQEGLELCTGYRRQDRGSPIDNLSFFDVGGNSSNAMLFVEYIMKRLFIRGTFRSTIVEGQILEVLFREPLAYVIEYVYKHVWTPEPYDINITYLDEVKSWREGKEESWLECPGPSYESVSRVHDPLMVLQEKESCLKHWKVSMFGCVDSSPVIVQCTMEGSPVCLGIVASHAGIVVAMDLSTLRRRESEYDLFTLYKGHVWSRTFGASITAAIVVCPSQEFLFISTCDNRVYCVQAGYGQIKWAFSTTNMCRVSPVLWSTDAGLKLLVYTEDRKLACLDSVNGTSLWTESVHLASSGKLWVHKNEIVGIATNLESVNKLNLVSKTVMNIGLNCEQKISTSLVPIFECTNSNPLLIFGTFDGHIEALNPTLSELWKKQPSGGKSRANTPVFHQCIRKDSETIIHEMIFYTTEGGRFVCLDLKGEELFTLNLGMKCSTTPVIAQNFKLPSWESARCTAFVVTMDSNIQIIDILERKLVKTISTHHSPQDHLKAFECFSSPTIHDNMLLFGSRDNYLHLLDLDTIQE